MIMTTLKIFSLHKEGFYGGIVPGCLYGKLSQQAVELSNIFVSI